MQLLNTGLVYTLRNLCGGKINFITPNNRKETKRTDNIPNVPLVTSLHSHNYMEIAQVIEGEPCLWLQDGKIVINDNNCYWILPGTLHAESFSDKAAPYKLLWGIIMLSGANFFISTYTPAKGFFVDSNLRFFWETEYAKHIYTVNMQSKNVCRLMDMSEIQAYLLLIISEVRRRLSDGKEINPKGKNEYHRRLVFQIEEYINAHYQSEISLNTLAGIAYCTPNHLNFVFRKIKGISIYKFITNIRLRRAAELLSSEKKLLIKEVSRICGFNDPLYFSKIFKKRYGVTPLKFKNGNTNFEEKLSS